MVVTPPPAYVVAPRPVFYRPAPVVVAPPMYGAPVYGPAYPVYGGYGGYGGPSLNLSIPLGPPSYPIW